ncbi:MAG TPA: radical SAM protein [bacterium]|nr:radical SAM protein [bacterium]
MRAHLINPPAAGGVDIVREGRCMQRAGAWTAVWAPISLATIGAVLEDAGVTCRLDDCIIEKISVEDVLSRARSFKPDLIVINTATPSIVSDLGLADRLKRELPGSYILAIGIHVTALPEESLRMAPGLDAVVRGEPELTVKDVAAALGAGRAAAGLAGVSARSGGGIAHGPERAAADLDTLPFPAWRLARPERYKLPFTGRPFLLIGTSRGCPFHCDFCADPAYYGHALRLKSPERIVSELKAARDGHGIRDFLFWSESFTLKREWTMAVLDAIIAADPGVRFVVNSRADHVDPELLTKLKRAGCWMIGFGLESGSARTLALMDKKITPEQNRSAVAWSREAGLQVTAHFVIGYPGETEDGIRETIEFACSLPLDYAQFYCAVPFPGSALYKKARGEGWLLDAPWELFEQNFSVLSYPGLSRERIMELRRYAYRRFYSRPARVWRVLKGSVGIRGAPRFVRMALSFREWI